MGAMLGLPVDCRRWIYSRSRADRASGKLCPGTPARPPAARDHTNGCPIACHPKIGASDHAPEAFKHRSDTTSKDQGLRKDQRFSDLHKVLVHPWMSWKAFSSTLRQMCSNVPVCVGANRGHQEAGVVNDDTPAVPANRQSKASQSRSSRTRQSILGFAVPSGRRSGLPPANSKGPSRTPPSYPAAAQVAARGAHG